MVCKALAVYDYRVSFQRYRPLKLSRSCEKGGFWAPICRGKGYPIFRTRIFTSHLLPIMWPHMVEFRSGSSEIRGRIKKERKREREETVVKHKPADMYVGRSYNRNAAR